jgi:hypothetical protein
MGLVLVAMDGNYGEKSRRKKASIKYAIFLRN